MKHIEVLGAYGGKGCGKNTTCFHIAKNITIDAGNILSPLKKESADIEHIFLTHSHLDHIIDIPFLIDAFYSDKKTPLRIYGLKETLDDLKTHILNWRIWPDFSELDLIDKSGKSILLCEIKIGERFEISGLLIEPITTCHTVASCGYRITKGDMATIITADTGVCDELLAEIEKTKNLKNLVIECSFPSRFKKLAEDSRHFTPEILAGELAKLSNLDFDIFLNHIKPSYENEIREEVRSIEILKKSVVLEDGWKIKY